jgi:hypothetical protein
MLGVSEGVPHPMRLLLALSVRSLLRHLLGDGRSLARGRHYSVLVHRRGVQAMHVLLLAVYSVMLTEPSGFSVFSSAAGWADVFSLLW